MNERSDILELIKNSTYDYVAIKIDESNEYFIANTFTDPFEAERYFHWQRGVCRVYEKGILKHAK